MSIHSQIAGRMERADRALDKIDEAMLFLDRSIVRKRMFLRAKERSDELVKEARNLAVYSLFPGMAEEMPYDSISQVGGLGRIYHSAKNAKAMIPEVSRTLEEDVSTIDFKTLEEEDKKLRPVQKILKTARAVAVAVLFIGIPAACFTETFDRMTLGLGSLIGGMAGFYLFSSIKQLFDDMVMPDARRIKEAVQSMREGLCELGALIEDLAGMTAGFTR